MLNRLALLFLAFAAMGCSLSAPDRLPPGDTPLPPAIDPYGLPPGDVPIPPAEDGKGGFVGLSKDRAIAEARASGKKWRVVREDGESYPVTKDLRPNRLNFTVEAGVVVGVTRG